MVVLGSRCFKPLDVDEVASIVRQERRLVADKDASCHLTGSPGAASFFAGSPALDGNKHDDPGHQETNQAHGNGIHKHCVQLVVYHSGYGIRGLG